MLNNIDFWEKQCIFILLSIIQIIFKIHSKSIQNLKPALINNLRNEIKDIILDSPDTGYSFNSLYDNVFTWCVRREWVFENEDAGFSYA